MQRWLPLLIRSRQKSLHGFALWLAGITACAWGAPLALPLPAASDFGFLWWADGPPYFHGQPAGYDPRPRGRLLCIRTGRYGLVVDTMQLKLPHLGPLSGSSRDDVIHEGNEHLLTLPPAEFELAVNVGGTEFHCVALPAPKDPFFFPVRFVEFVLGRFSDCAPFRSTDNGAVPSETATNAISRPLARNRP